MFICREKSFEIFFAIKNASEPEIIIVVIISKRCWSVISCRICFIANAAPVLVLLIEKTVIKLNPMTIVFIAPSKIRNPFCVCSINSEPMTAACPEPIPGRKEQRGAEIIAPRIAFRNSGFGTLICFNGRMICFGIVGFCFIVIINVDVPNNPVSNGRRGCSTGRLKVARPKNPARMKVVSVKRKFSSLKIKYNERKIKMKGRIVFIELNIIGIM